MPTAAEAAQRTISETERLIAEMFKLPEGQRRAFMNRERIPLAQHRRLPGQGRREDRDLNLRD
jgi:hypothetical protein